MLARLRRLPPALALVLVLKVLESYCDFVTGINLSLYLSRDLGYTDTEAGLVYGIWGVSTSVCGILLGSVIDRLGVRRSLLVGASCSLCGRLLLAVTSSRFAACFALFGLLGVGEAFAIPVLSIAVRHLMSDERELGLAFSVFYMAMQVGAIAAGFITDAVRAATDNALSVLLGSTPLVTAVYLGIVARYFPSTVTAKRSVAYNTRALCSDSAFWRLVVFSLLLTGSRTVWRHLDVSMPKYILRTLGEHARYGDVYAIEPAIVLMSVTFISALTSRYDAYDTIVVGTLITALSPLVLFLGAPTYTTLVLFMVMLSLGEIIYSPRVYEYTLRLAPRGHEGIYSALASAPLFLIRLVSGAASGMLLEAYCGDSSAIVHCQTLWLIVALVALSTPLALMLARRCVYTEDIRARTNNSASPETLPSVMEASKE